MFLLVFPYDVFFLASSILAGDAALGGSFHACVFCTMVDEAFHSGRCFRSEHIREVMAVSSFDR